MATIKITSANFEQITSQDKLVLLDFYTQTCPPCRMLAPILEELSSESEDYIIGKVDAYEQMELAQKYSITQVPTMILIKSGKILGQVIGLRSKNDIKNMLEANK